MRPQEYDTAFAIAESAWAHLPVTACLGAWPFHDGYGRPLAHVLLALTVDGRLVAGVRVKRP